MKRKLLLFLALGIVYLLLPRDLIPDMIGLVGRLDDIIVILYLFWAYRKGVNLGKISPEEQAQGQSSDFKGEREKAFDSGPKQNGLTESKPWDPYLVLEINRNATKEEIISAHRRLAAQYHPDKVNHLGGELRELAHQKMVAIQRAFEELKEKA